MHSLHRHARLALVVAGRRVVQPFYARTLRVSLPCRAEPDPPTLATTDVTSPEPPKQPKKKSKTPPPSPKPNGKKPSPVTRKKSKSLITRGSKRVRKTKGVPAAHELGGTGFITDDWGKDGASAHSTSECNLVRCIELAPPSPTKRRTASKLRPRKEIVPGASKPSSSSRALPPHRIPYVRCTQGYISDQAEKCNNVLRGASRVQSK
jgi:hypothetical protein